MKNISDNKRLDNIALLRTIAIIGVVLYHAFWAPFFTPFEKLLLVSIPLSPVYESIFHIWLGARMPLFIFISGYLYSYLYNQRGKYVATKEFIKKKFTRLIIPYAVFTILMGLSLSNLSIAYFFNGYMHLWFILMIFWCFIFIRLIAKVKNNIFIHILIFSLFSLFYGAIPMTEFDRKTVFFGFDMGLKFFCWFWLGYIVFLNKEKISFIFKKRFIFLFFLIWLICCIYLQLFSGDRLASPDDRLSFNIEINDSNLDNIIAYYSSIYFSQLAFIFLIYTIVENAFQKGYIKMRKWVEDVNQCSYGIYIFHLWILYFILYSTKNTSIYTVTQTFANNYPVLFPLILFVISFFLSLLITKLLLKKPFGRFLLGQ